MHTVDILKNLVEHHLLLTYFLIFFITIFEGEIIAISAGILVLLGALNFWFALIVIFLGGMVKTICGYSLGKFLHSKFNSNKFFQHIEKRVLTMMPHFKQKPFWSIFISKFLMVNHLVILFAGYKSIDFKKYFRGGVVSTLFWAQGMMLLGYFFSYAAIRVSEEIWRFSLIILVLVILFVVLDRIVGWLYEIFEELYDEAK